MKVGELRQCSTQCAIKFQERHELAVGGGGGDPLRSRTAQKSGGGVISAMKKRGGWVVQFVHRATEKRVPKWLLSAGADGGRCLRLFRVRVSSTITWLLIVGTTLSVGVFPHPVAPPAPGVNPSVRNFRQLAGGSFCSTACTDLARCFKRHNTR